METVGVVCVVCISSIVYYPFYNIYKEISLISREKYYGIKSTGGNTSNFLIIPFLVIPPFSALSAAVLGDSREVRECKIKETRKEETLQRL